MLVEPPLRPGWLRALVLLGVGLCLSLLAWWPAIDQYPSTQFGDGQGFLRVFDIAHISIGRWHELPLWNPYECGGVPLWDNPELPVASPWVFLTAGLRAPATMLVWYVLHLTLGFVAMWLFCRHELRASRASTLVGACLWAFGVAHTSQYAGGHAALSTFLYLPGALLLWRRAQSSWNAAVGLGLLVAAIMFDGGVYPLVHIGSILALETVLRVGRHPTTFPRVFGAAVVTMVVGLSVGACRFLPVFDQLRHHSRDLGVETDKLSLSTLRSMLLDRSHDWRVEGQTYVWPEYMAYTGRVVLVLALVGALLGGWETAWLLVLGGFVFAMMLGHVRPWAPWAWLKTHVFPFKAMRVPSRYRISFTFFLASFVVVALERAPRLFRRWPAGGTLRPSVRHGLVALALLAAGDVLSLTSDIVASKFVLSNQATVEPSPRFYLEGPDLANFIDQPRQNRGRMACTDSWPFTEGAPLWLGDVPQARAVDPAALVVTDIKRTQNRMIFTVDAHVAGRVLLNLPYERGFRTNRGVLVDANRQLAVDLPAGRARVVVRYWPPLLTTGFVVSGLGLVGVLLFFGRERLRARRRPEPVEEQRPADEAPPSGDAA